MLSRVLIEGEKFGRAAWQDKEAQFRQQMLRVFAPTAATKGPEIPLEEEAINAPRPRKDVKIVAIDLQPISPLPGITTLRADITHPATVPLLLKALDPEYEPSSMSQQASHPVDLVLSDGAPDVTGLHDLDIYVQSQLLFAALNLALCVLKPGGKFVAKIFRGRNVDVLYAQLKLFFDRVIVAKPRSSRASSIEAFIVCLDFQPPPGFIASLDEPLGVGHKLPDMIKERAQHLPIIASTAMQNPITCAWESSFDANARARLDEVVEMDFQDETVDDEKDVRWIAPFIACGDLSAFDSDASYQLPDDHVTLDPVQPPTAPPYKRAIEMRRAAGGAYGKTVKS